MVSCTWKTTLTKPISQFYIQQFLLSEVLIVISVVQIHELPHDEGRSPFSQKQFLGMLMKRSKKFASVFYVEN